MRIRISGKSDAILGADAMTLRSHEITIGSHSTACVYSNATDIVVNQENNIIQHLYWGENISTLK